MEDGLVDRYFNRRLSGHLTRLFLKTSVTPNQITLISFLVGLISGLFFWKGGYTDGIIGALVFQISAVLDCCDGEVARLKAMQSRIGQWLDVVCDNVVHVVLFLAMAWAIYRATGAPSELVLGGLASIGSFFSLGFVLLLQRQPPGDPWSPHANDRYGFLRKATDRLTNRDFSVILFIFALLGRLDWFLWLAALGSNIFWVVLLWLYRKEARSFS
ncbi:MAG TPA: CDP-alcohol phosphatidyltransferase family protein [Nitrospiria bacterium]|nr:CDP-alcohol phosphatidyltransferase family protein [Nitrospiria bacterium]